MLMIADQSNVKSVKSGEVDATPISGSELVARYQQKQQQ